MNKRNLNIIQNEKGIVLLIALMVLIMLSLMGLAAILTGTTDIQIAGNEAQSTQALYVAEAGVSEVKSWFEDPSTFSAPGSYTLDRGNPPDGTYAFPGDFFKKRRTDGNGAPSYLNAANISQFTDINGQNGVDSNDANNINDDGHTTDQNINRTGDHPVLSITDTTYLNDPATGLFKDLLNMGRVTVLEIYPPMLSTNYATVRVTAVDAAGVTRTIEQEIGPSMNFSVNAGLNVGSFAGWNGNGSVHWGPVVVSGDVNAGQNSVHCQTGSCNGGVDPWWSLDATGNITVSGVGPPWPATNYAITPNSPKTPQTLSDDQKTKLMDYAQRNGGYYEYCSDGKVHQGGIGNDPIGTDFQTLTQNKTNPFLYVKLGTSAACNSTTPSPLPEVSVGGGGGYYTNSNIILDHVGFNINGSGGTTNIPVTDPGGTTSTKGVHYNGFLYTTENFDSGGNPVFYGAVITEKGYKGSGTPDIWYNAKLKDGLPSLPQTSIQGWREIHPH